MRASRPPIAIHVGVVVFGLLLLLGVMLVASRDVYSPGLVLAADFAATSLQTWEAMHLREIYGVPSWNGWHHPGPALPYFRALVEFIVRLFWPDMTDAATQYTGHIAFVGTVCVLCCLLSVRLFESARLGLAFSSILFAMLLMSPGLLKDPWEPTVAAMLFLPWLLTAPLAIRHGAIWLFFFILLGSFCIHMQVSVALPVMLVSALTAILFVRQHHGDVLRLRHVWPALAGLFIGIAPIVLDLSLMEASNTLALLEWRTQAARAPSNSALTALNLLVPNLPPLSVVGFPALSVGVWAIGSSWSRRNPLTNEICAPVANRDIAAMLALCGVCILGGFAFYRFVATADYSPAHATTFAGVVCLLLLASTVWLAWSHLFERFSSWGLLACNFLPALIVGWMALVSNHRDLGFSIVAGEHTLHELLHVRDDLSARTTEKGTFLVGIVVDFPPEDPSVHLSGPEEREFPWRAAVGLANLLHRAGVKKCVAFPLAPRISTGTKAHASRVLSLFMRAAPCTTEPDTRVTFSCNASGLIFEHEGRTTRLSGC